MGGFLVLYPLKFKPLYKDYIWGGRNLERLGKKLPEGIVAESWELSCHPDGQSIISNGFLEGTTLGNANNKYGSLLMGSDVSKKYGSRFPLMVKLIDSNADLSVQVHPGNEYASKNENGEYGKNEMWYIIDAKPNAELYYHLVPGTTKEQFENAVKNNEITTCLKKIKVKPGDVIDIPAGVVHSLGKGILLIEIQQTSNLTYRIYDYNRTDDAGKKRPLHLEKAMDVIDFSRQKDSQQFTQIVIKKESGLTKTCLLSNEYFCVDMYDINKEYKDTADGKKFFMYTIINGEGIIKYNGNTLKIEMGDTFLIPASLGNYKICGELQIVKAYVPSL